MNHPMLKRSGLTLIALACVAGCTTSKPTETTAVPAADSTVSYGTTDLTSAERVKVCKSRMDACRFEGAYERGEAKYALQEAKRLNAIALQKFRDSVRQP